MSKPKEIKMLSEIAGGYPLKFALPILFGFGETQESLYLNNGTVSLIDFGQGKFFITCFHVFESFLEKLEKMPNSEKPLLQTGNLSIKTEPSIIDRSKELDLITVKLNDFDHKQMRHLYSNDTGDSFINTTETSAITTNDRVAFGGFPGQFREKPDAHHVKLHSFCTSLVKISSVKENEIVCQLDDLGDLKRWEKISGKKDELKSAGGLSGGPVFIMKSSPVLHWTFIGVIREGGFINKTLFIYVRLTNCINPDGSINK